MPRILTVCLALRFLVVASAVLTVSIGSVLASPKGARWGADYFPNHPVVTQDGETLRFYDDLIKDKMVVINFIYTNCPDICSLSTARLALVQERLGERVGRDVFMYSISLDPERDTPETLKAYSRAFKAGPGWLFLTGKPEEIAQIRHKLGDRSRKLSEHRNDVMLGNDATGDWSRGSTMDNLNRLTRQILELDPNWLRQRHKLVAKRVRKGSFRFGNQPGEALFLKTCASCHSFGKGDRVGPDLSGVTARRDHDWLVRFLIAPDRMRGQKDPIALQLYAKYEGVFMPNLGLGENDAEDLIAYMEARTKALDAQTNSTEAQRHPRGSHQHEHGVDHQHANGD